MRILSADVSEMDGARSFHIQFRSVFADLPERGGYR